MHAWQSTQGLEVGRFSGQRVGTQENVTVLPLPCNKEPTGMSPIPFHAMNHILSCDSSNSSQLVLQVARGLGTGVPSKPLLSRLYALWHSDVRWRFLGLSLNLNASVRDSELYPVVGCDARMMRARMGALAQSVLPRFANVSVIRGTHLASQTICTDHMVIYRHMPMHKSVAHSLGILWGVCLTMIKSLI